MRVIFLVAILLLNYVSAPSPFRRGVHLTKWFQAATPQQIQFSKYKKADFENILSLGCDVIRLPINLHAMADSADGYNLDPLFLTFLDQAVDWAEELNLHLILDNHTFDPSSSTDPNIGDILIPVWRNMADHFKNRPRLIYFEVLNEPHGISSDVWNAIQQSVVAAIREIDSVHTIIVGPSDWNSYNKLSEMPVYADTNLIYTFHFYDPFIFTHQGATWVSPSMINLRNVPFPYNQSEMPPLPDELLGSWVHNLYNNYPTDGTEQKVKELINIADAFQKSRNVPLFCGEFGVYKLYSDNEDRVAWYQLVREYLESNGIEWTIWDYQGGFGLFENDTDELFDYDLNMPLIRALGLNEVEQKDSTITPEVDPLPIYRDQIEEGINESSWNSSGVLDFYSTDDPAEGTYCIYWADADRYNTIGFDFRPDKDFTVFADSASGVYFTMDVKCNTPGAAIGVRLIDTDTDDPNDHPWRMGCKIEENDSLHWDGNWHTLAIPLTDFEELGAWESGNWYEPVGAFDWSAIDRFEIVAEYQALTGIKFWFDNIAFMQIGTDAADNSPQVVRCFELKQNYPNPFNPYTVISFSLPNPSQTSLKVYNTLGEKIVTLVDKNLTVGEHKYGFSGKGIASGIYYYELVSGPYHDVKRMIYLK
jgi:endoglucanase